MWNVERAYIRSVRLVRNALIDLRYGKLLLGSVPSRFRDAGSKDTVNTDYAALPYIFAGQVAPTDVLVEVGCGKGRVINWWLDQGWRNTMIGYELDADIAAQTAQRLRKFPNVEIIGGDICKTLIEAGTVYYLYNPFTAPVMQRFKERLLEIHRAARSITLLYYNCKYAHVFADDPNWSVQIVDVGPPSALPFNQLATIKLRR